jgi:predicted MarR family transcription regulator
VLDARSGGFDLLGAPYTANQMNYDLARLRHNGLIERLPQTNTYVLTNEGQRVAIFYTKVHDRLLRPLLAADQPPAPPALRKALRTIDTHVVQYIDAARLPLKAA